MGPEKGLGFGWGEELGGKPRAGRLTKALVQAGTQANRCAGATQAFQTCDASNPFPSGTARGWVGLAERPGQSCECTPEDTTRWKAPWVERPFGSAGKSDSSRRREREGRQLPLGLELKRWCPKGDRAVSEIGFVSVKAPPAIANRRRARGVRIQGAARCHRARMLKRGSGGSNAKPGQRVHRSRVDRSERARTANAHLNSQTARTVLARHRGFLLPNEDAWGIERRKPRR